MPFHLESLYQETRLSTLVAILANPPTLTAVPGSVTTVAIVTTGGHFQASFQFLEDEILKGCRSMHLIFHGSLLYWVL